MSPLSKFVHRLEVVPLDPHAYSAATGERPKRAIYRSSKPAQGPIFDGAAELRYLGFARVDDESPFLPALFYDQIPTGTRHRKGADPAPALARLLAGAAAQEIGTFAWPDTAPEMRRVLRDTAEVCIEHAVPQRDAAAMLRAKRSACGATVADLAALLNVDVDAIVEDTYSQGATRGEWGSKASAVEEADRARRAAEAKAKAEQEQAEAYGRALVPLEVAGADFFIVAENAFALEGAPERYRELVHHNGRTLESGEIVVAIANDGIAPARDVEIAPGVWMLRAETVAERYRVKRAALGSMRLVHALSSSHVEWLADLANAHRKFDSRPLADADSRTLKDPAVYYALDRIAERLAFLLSRAIVELGAVNSRCVVRSRRRCIDLYREAGIRKDIAIDHFVEAAHEHWLSGTPEPADFARREREKSKTTWTFTSVTDAVRHVLGDETDTARYVPKTWDQVRPAQPWGSEAEVRELFDEMYRGHGTEVSPLSRIEVPPTPWMDRFYAAAPVLDPKRGALAELLKDKPHAFGHDVERALFGREATPTERQRIVALMAKLGWKKGRAGGRRAWVPATSPDVEVEGATESEVAS
jgi:hypothetical protein